MWQHALPILFLLLSAWQFPIAKLEDYDRQEDNVERECDNFGASLGRLELRKWREGGEMVARCYLNRATSGLNYAILWTYSHDAESKRVLRMCEFDHEDLEDDTEIVCEYRHKISEEESDKTFLCWVKTTNVWNSESRTACVSEEIHNYSPSHDLAIRNPQTRRGPPRMPETREYPPRMPETREYPPRIPETRRLAPLVEGRPLKFGERYLTEPYTDDEKFNTSVWQHIQLPEPYGRYLLAVGDKIVTKCIITVQKVDETVIMEFSGSARLNQTPQVMVWNASLLYKGHLTGFFTVYIRRGNVEDVESGSEDSETDIVKVMKRGKKPKMKQIVTGEVMKVCNRTQMSYVVPIKCTLVLPLSDRDLGSHAFTVNFKYTASGADMKKNKSQHCHVPRYIEYHVSKDPSWVRERIILKDEIIFVKKRPHRRFGPPGYYDAEGVFHPSNFSMDELYPDLPWSVSPVIGAGPALNGVQLTVIMAGGVGVLLVCGCVCSGVSTVLRKRTEAMTAYRCPCNDPGHCRQPG